MTALDVELHGAAGEWSGGKTQPAQGVWTSPCENFVRNSGEGLNVLNLTTILHSSRKEHTRPRMIVWEKIPTHLGW